MKATLFATIVFFSITTIWAQKPGTLDSSFGINGIASTVWSLTGTVKCKNLIYLPNGRFIATGMVFANGKYQFLAVKHKSNGQVDSSFGLNGFAEFDFPGATYSYSYCSALQKDGKIVLGGDYSLKGYSFGLMRLKPNGTLDSTFGINGRAGCHAGADGADNTGNAMAIQADGRIVIAGTSYNGSNNDYTAVRFLSNGKVDSGFGVNGVVVMPIGSEGDNCYSMAIQGDSKILLGGDIQSGSNYYFAVLRLKTNGKPDSSFASNGILIKSLVATDDDYGYSMVVQPDQKILLGGTAKSGFNYNCCVLRIKPNGTLDSSFGAGGVFLSGFTSTSSDYGQAMVLHPTNGKIAMAARCYVAGSSFGVMLIKPNGTLDSAFGTNGGAYKAIYSAQHYIYTLAIQQDGKIVLAGQVNLSTSNEVHLLRYHSGLPTFNLARKTIEESSPLVLYPNPAHDILYFNGQKSGRGNSELCIYNSMGQMVMKTEMSASVNSLNISSLKPGLYIMKVSNAANQVGTMFIKD